MQAVILVLMILQAENDRKEKHIGVNIFDLIVIELIRKIMTYYVKLTVL